MAQLIIALDFPEEAEALKLAKQLMGHVSWVKVGLQLFIASGPALIKDLKNYGFNVFLDLKFYDIPNTVAGAVKSAEACGADMLTLHLQGGRRMCEAARNCLDHEPKPILAGVTVLTSFENGSMPGVDYSPAEYGYILAKCAVDWGLTTIVCSPLEVEKIKKDLPQLNCVCPGIRLADNKEDDQRRIATPGFAVKAGADYLVVGRPVTRAREPVAAAQAIIQDMRNIN